MIWPRKWLSNTANQSMSIIGLRFSLTWYKSNQGWVADRFLAYEIFLLFCLLLHVTLGVLDANWTVVKKIEDNLCSHTTVPLVYRWRQ